MMKTVADLIPGESAIVKGFSGEMESQSRLVEMGIILGTSVRLIRDTPFNGPIEIKVREFYLSLRKQDAQRIIVSND